MMFLYTIVVPPLTCCCNHWLHSSMLLVVCRHSILFISHFHISLWPVLLLQSSVVHVCTTTLLPLRALFPSSWGGIDVLLLHVTLMFIIMESHHYYSACYTYHVVLRTSTFVRVDRRILSLLGGLDSFFCHYLVKIKIYALEYCVGFDSSIY